MAIVYGSLMIVAITTQLSSQIEHTLFCITHQRRMNTC